MTKLLFQYMNLCRAYEFADADKWPCKFRAGELTCSE